MIFLSILQVRKTVMANQVRQTMIMHQRNLKV